MSYDPTPERVGEAWDRIFDDWSEDINNGPCNLSKRDIAVLWEDAATMALRVQQLETELAYEKERG